MLKSFLAPALLLLALAGPAAAETRSLAGFDSVKAEDKLRVEIAVGPAFAVDIQGADSAMVRTRIVGGELQISQLNRPWFGSGPSLDAVVHVTMPRVIGVAAARGAQLNANVAGPCRSLSAVAAMGGIAHVNGVACETVDATAAMGGELNLAGTCGALDVTGAMGGVVRAKDLQCHTVDATAAMGGDINAYASQSYDATASMGGSIDVGGESSARRTSAVMGGSIEHSR